MTLKNRALIVSATKTAKCCLCGYFLFSLSQYSIVRMMWLSSVTPSITSTSYMMFSVGSFNKISSRPPCDCDFSLATISSSPRFKTAGLLAIWSCSQYSSKPLLLIETDFPIVMLSIKTLSVARQLRFGCHVLLPIFRRYGGNARLIIFNRHRNKRLQPHNLKNIQN